MTDQKKPYSSDELSYLRRMAVQIRANIIEMLDGGKVGHLGGSASLADILSALYFHRMRNLDPKNPKNPDRDRLILSKGHAVLAQYAALVELGYFDRSELKKLKTLSGILQGHPDIGKTPGLEAVTGSLGQGLSISSGIAMALKLDKNPAKVFCICGDGELAEGQIWEAAMGCANYRLDNLCLFVDRNGIQATDAVDCVFPLGNIAGKFAAFGWHAVETDGHDIRRILEAIDEADSVKGVPTVVVADTVKGKGFPFAEGKAAFHNAALSAGQYAEAKKCIGKMREENER